jgi:integrase-like protein
VVFAALTGLRQGEVFGLCRSDVDLASRVVRVERSARAGTFGKTKSGRKRVVHLTVVAAEVAAEQLASRDGGSYDLVFPSPAGRMWRKDNFMARVFRPAVRRAELDGLTFHDLRHTYASLMVAAGASPHVIAEQLGHRDARLVLQRYGHLYPGASRQATLALDLYLEAAGVGQVWGGGGWTDEPSEERPGNRGGAYRDRTGDLRLAKLRQLGVTGKRQAERPGEQRLHGRLSSRPVPAGSRRYLSNSCQVPSPPAPQRERPRRCARG